MATLQLPIFGRLFPDASGDVYPSTLNVELTMANPKILDCMVMEFPTGSDIGGELAFTVPPDYVGTPVLVIKGVIDGASTDTLAFGALQVSVADNEPSDVAYEAEDLASADITGWADEDMYEETIALTPAAPYVAADTVFLLLFRDDDVDDTTINFLLTDLLFQYSDA